MGKPSKRPQWALVLALLGVALLLVGALVRPGLFEGPGRADAQRRDAEGPVDAGAGGAGGGADAESQAAEAGGAPVPAELPPYGDKSLPPGESIRGRVIDAEGKPVPDAIVEATYRDWRRQPSTLVSSARVRTEADGTFVAGPLEGQDYALYAVKEGVGIAYSASHKPGAWVELLLGPAVRLEGTVTVRETREPVAGVRVFVHDWLFRSESLTDAEGKYSFASLPPALHAWSGFTVVASAEGFRRSERSNLVAKGGRTYRVDFALEKGATLAGRVVDARTQQPLPAAVVGEGWEPFHRTTSSRADGTYSLPNVDSSPNREFVAHAPGYLPQRRQSDGTGTLDFELDAAVAVEGIVLDRADAPVRGARVYLHRISYAPGFQSDAGSQQGNVTTSGEGGRFRFDNVLPGQVAAIAFHRDHAPGEQHPVVVPVGGPGPKDVRIRLREGLSVEGDVCDRDERPLAGVTVQLQSWEAVPGYTYALNYRWNESPVTLSDEKGKFRLRGALPGQQWLNAYHPSYGWTGRQISGADGQRITDVRISFAGGAIEGRLVTAGAEPVSRAWVYAMGPKNTPQQTQRYAETDAFGRFRLGGLPEGRYDIRANLPSGNAEPVLDVPTGTTGLEIVLKPTQVLAGEVRSAVTGRPVERYSLAIQPERDPAPGRRGSSGTSWMGDVQAPDGRFEQPVSPGRYQVVVRAPGHEPAILEGIVVEELVAPAPLDVVLDAGGGIEGTLRDPNGRPLPNTHVSARFYRGPGAADRMDWTLGGSDQTDSRGRFFLEGLRPGTYLLQANLGQMGAAVASVAVAGAEMVHQDLALLPTGTVVVRVTDEADNPVPGVQIHFLDSDGNWVGWGGFTNPQGEARSEALRSGPATLRTHHPEEKYVSDPMPVEILPGRELTVLVRMRSKGEAGTPTSGKELEEPEEIVESEEE